MVRNEAKYEEAVRLRERGFTLVEIARYCDVSKSTVSKWLKNNAMSVVVTKQNKRRAGQANAKRLQLMNKARAAERTKRYDEAKKSAVTEFRHYQRDPLFVAGLIAYRSVGDMKDPHQLRLSTSRSETHRVFIKFAVEYLGVSKHSIRFWLLLINTQSEETCLKFWKRTTTLPYTQFGKTQFVNQGTQGNVLHHGVGNTIIGSTVLKLKLLHWCKLLTKTL